MIRIPVCFNCIYYDETRKNCPVFPDGIPGKVFAENRRDGKLCSEKIKYEERK